MTATPTTVTPTTVTPTTAAPAGPTTAAPAGPTTAAPAGLTTAALGPTTAAPGPTTAGGPARSRAGGRPDADRPAPARAGRDWSDVPALVLAATVATPGGDVALAVTPDGVVRAAGYAPLDAVLGRLRAAYPGVVSREVAPADLPGDAVPALERYAAGDAGALEAVPVTQPGGEFFQAAWDAMRRIPPGRTVTYTELAAMAGRPAAVRAAGTACARNLVAPFVPCHRIVRTDGSLGGYAFGVATKQALLAHERGAAS
ncbi:methylated-DNA--[protein]-cysteine S-methyltransferase [Actinotalea solisilvae]|uniref:methylated-DNA--[protein]-cysteine S-methyltransferase n=1 Tax=Actinotalea solisilvae TaxID=2072922 RepID=UPI0018F1793A|nr:methylated-DNA--[protein]-cysteine S-methyltransferase [Actinotalea solisilvae]